MNVKPCRRCGNTVPLEDGRKIKGLRGSAWRVICTKCDARTGWEEKRKEAISKWNAGDLVTYKIS